MRLTSHIREFVSGVMEELGARLLYCACADINGTIYLRSYTNFYIVTAHSGSAGSVVSSKSSHLRVSHADCDTAADGQHPLSGQPEVIAMACLIFHMLIMLAGLIFHWTNVHSILFIKLCLSLCVCDETQSTKSNIRGYLTIWYIDLSTEKAHRRTMLELF